MVTVLALDQAPKNIGWAWGSDETGPVKEQWGCRENPDYGGDEIQMMRQFRKWLGAKLDESAAEIVTVEQIVINRHHINTVVLHQQFALVAAVQFICMDRDLDCRMVDISEWRGRARIPTQQPKWSRHNPEWLKDAARVTCAERGWLIENHHAAEATLMLDYMLARLSVPYQHRTGPALRRIEQKYDDARRAFG